MTDEDFYEQAIESESEMFEESDLDDMMNEDEPDLDDIMAIEDTELELSEGFMSDIMGFEDEPYEEEKEEESSQLLNPEEKNMFLENAKELLEIYKNIENIEDDKEQYTTSPDEEVDLDFEEEQNNGAENLVELEQEDIVVPGFDEEEENEEDIVIPGFDEEEENEEDIVVPGFDEEEENEEDIVIPGFGEEEENEEDIVVPGFDEEEENEEDIVIPGFGEEEENEEGIVMPEFDEEEEKNTPIFNKKNKDIDTSEKTNDFEDTSEISNVIKKDIKVESEVTDYSNIEENVFIKVKKEDFPEVLEDYEVNLLRKNDTLSDRVFFLENRVEEYKNKYDNLALKYKKTLKQKQDIYLEYKALLNDKHLILSEKEELKYELDSLKIDIEKMELSDNKILTNEEYNLFQGKVKSLFLGFKKYNILTMELQYDNIFDNDYIDTHNKKLKIKHNELNILLKKLFNGSLNLFAEYEKNFKLLKQEIKLYKEYNKELLVTDDNMYEMSKSVKKTIEYKGLKKEYLKTMEENERLNIELINLKKEKRFSLIKYIKNIWYDVTNKNS
jgi:co-chaperonin GroES (HSP10)